MKLHRDLDEIPRTPTDCPIHDETCKQLNRDKLYGHKLDNDDYFGVKQHNNSFRLNRNKNKQNHTNYSPTVTKTNENHYKVITAKTKTQHHVLKEFLETLTKYPVLPLEIASEIWKWSTLKALIKQKIIKIWRHDKHGPCLKFMEYRRCPYCGSTKREAIYKNLDKIVYCKNCQGTYYKC